MLILCKTGLEYRCNSRNPNMSHYCHIFKGNPGIVNFVRLRWYFETEHSSIGIIVPNLFELDDTIRQDYSTSI